MVLEHMVLDHKSRPKYKKKANRPVNGTKHLKHANVRRDLSIIGLHREIVPPRETVAIAIVGRGGWGSLPYTVANENQMKA